MHVRRRANPALWVATETRTVVNGRKRAPGRATLDAVASTLDPSRKGCSGRLDLPGISGEPFSLYLPLRPRT